MKKCLFLQLAIALLIFTMPARAQRIPRIKSVKPVTRGGIAGQVEGAVMRRPVLPTSGTGAVLTGTQSVAAQALATPPVNTRPTTVGAVARQALPAGQFQLSQPGTVPATDGATIEGLVAQHGALVTEAQQLNTVGFGGGFGRSVLFAPVQVEGKTGGFSVTAIEIDGEIFGVIASHVLPESWYTLSNSLHKQFQVSVKGPNGTEQLMPAEVVQSAPRSMIDLSLVKFSPQAEQWVKPLKIADNSAQPNEQLLSPGFAAGQAQTETRTVLQRSFLSVRTDQNLLGERQGFCGSPILDQNGQVKAIHTGTRVGKDQTELSYGTHAQFINLLVQAYHNDGQAVYTLQIDNHAMARLNVDEYISAVSFYDENGKRIAQKNMPERFSESFVTRTMDENPHVRFVEFTSRQARWETDSDGDAILLEDRSRRDNTKRHHWYDVYSRQILPARPDVIKM